MYYTYSQNNSWGKYVIDDDLTKYVIIEADSKEEADTIAESKGIYFDGCSNGMDCPCCGNRWSRAEDYYAEEFPSVYGERVDENYKLRYNKRTSDAPEIIVHHKDGRKECFCE